MIAPGLRFGRYEVGERIGKGGFGVVHFAKDVELGRELAIKFLRPEYQARANVVQRFLQEARAAARIGHPGIVTVFECGQVSGTGLRADGTAFIAMELLKGKSLSETMDLAGRPALAVALSIGRQLATALANAHEAGIIHRDLKPDNVFLIPDPAVRGGVRVKILDFGVAKLAETEVGVHTHSQVMLGTPRYMAPEQARSAARVDHRSDIYALGCILYELLSGRPPYSGDAGDVITKHQSAPVPPLRKAVESPPRELEQLISRMLAKTPDERPSSMADVDAALGTCETLAQPFPERDTLPEETTIADPPIAVDRTEPVGKTEPVGRFELMKTDPVGRFELLAKTEPVGLHEEPTTVRAPIVVESTLSEATSVRLPRQPKPGRPMQVWLLIAGGLVVGVLVVVLASRSGGEAPAGTAAAAAGDAAIAAADAAIAAGDAAAAVESGSEAPVPVPPTTPDAAAPSSELEIECLRYQSDQDWEAVDACADRMKTASPELAKELKNRAILETKAAPRIALFEDALRDKNLKQARAALDAIPSAVTSYAKLRAKYDQAEAAAIHEVAARLERAKDGDCKEYNQLLQQERATKPPRVAAEAARQVKCTASAGPLSCDAQALADKAKDQYALGQLAAALAGYEAAWSCKPDPQYAEKAFVIACNLPSAGKAKLFWKRLSPIMRQRALMICMRNGITEDMLNGP
jgi:serine/threonine protein kinase